MALTLFARCEGETLDGTHDYSAGDTTWAASGGATITSAAARIGSNGMRFVTASDMYTLDAASIVSVNQGAIAFSFRVASWVNGTIIFDVIGTAANDTLKVELTAGDELLFRHRGSGQLNTTIATTNASLTTGTWYGVVVRWNPTTDARKIEVYNASNTLIEEVESTAEAISPQTDFISIRPQTNSTVDVDIDNILIGDSYSDPLQNNLTITSYTEYGGGTAVPVFKHIYDLNG